MKRKIEFRAMPHESEEFAVDNMDKFLYGFIMLIPERNKAFIRQFHYDLTVKHNNGWQSYRVDPETIGEYTGGKLNDTKIYQGDLIRVNEYLADDTVEKEAIYEVVYDEFGFFCRNEKDCYLSLFDIIKNYGGEIVGNIIDNPELLAR